MVRFTYIYLRPVALFLSIVVLFQCCKVYYKKPVSIDEALKSDIKRVKIITTDDRVFVFDSIYFAHDRLYGHLIKTTGQNKTEKVGIGIKEDTIKEIFLYSKKKSKGLTGALLVVGIPIGFTLIVLIGCALDEECNNMFYQQ